MAATALDKTKTSSWKGMAIMAQQLQDNTGAAIDMTELTALSGQLATNLKNGSTHLAAGATKTLTSADSNKWVDLDTAAGSVVTLPAASGTGNVFKFRVKTLATTNSHIVKVANSSDAMQGIIVSMDDTASNAVAFAAVSGTDDTITLNRTTTGSVTLGETFTVEDIATNLFLVRGTISNTGSPATPFSATV